MFLKIAASASVFFATAFLGAVDAQQYQQYQYQAPSTSNLTGGGIGPANQDVGGGMTQPPGSGYGQGYTIPTGGGMSASTESVGGGVIDTPYSAYGSGYAAGLSGGGTNAVTPGSANSGGLAVAPNGETYKSLGITGY
jgi:hypothetical protein